MSPNWTQLLLLLTPVLLIQLGLAVYAIVDLARRPLVRGPRGLWLGLLIISALAIPTGILVSGLYLAWGRHAEVADDTN